MHWFMMLADYCLFGFIQKLSLNEPKALYYFRLSYQNKSFIPGHAKQAPQTKTPTALTAGL